VDGDDGAQTGFAVMAEHDALVLVEGGRFENGHSKPPQQTSRPVGARRYFNSAGR
jgi:hypothetical protein